jgi:hypothetical protein
MKAKNLLRISSNTNHFQSNNFQENIREKEQKYIMQQYSLLRTAELPSSPD